jgi:glycosyltransferase involved in cell wall biosynthesis
VEPDLNSYIGHIFNYTYSVYLAARREQINTKVLGSKRSQLEISKILPLEPIFDSLLTRQRAPSRVESYFLRPFQCNWFFYRGMSSPVTKFLDQDWVVFIGSVTTHNIIGLYFWLKHFQPEKSPAVVLFMRFSCSRKGRVAMSFSLLILWRFLLIPLIKKLSSRYRVYFVTDSEKLAEEYKHLTGLPVTVLPIPHTNSEQPIINCPKDSIKILNPGGARNDKGFVLLANAIKLMHGRKQLKGISFILHCYIFKNDKKSAMAIGMLKNLNLPNVKLIEETVDESEYHRMIGSSDAVVLPYFKLRYFANTSGIFTEALAEGKPVIVTEGTWMSDQLKEAGAGVSFKDRDVEGLIQAILKTREQYSFLSKQAIERRDKWVAYHNPDNFIRELSKAVN